MPIRYNQPRLLAFLTFAAALCGAPAAARADGLALTHDNWHLFASATEGVGIDRPDGTFGVKLGGIFQTRYALSGGDGGIKQSEFSVPVARVQMKAHLLRPWFRLMVQPELAGTTPRLLDLEIEAQPVPELGVKLGQFVTPFSRTYITPLAKILFATFSPANDYFRADRDTGAMIYGYPAKGRAEYYVGIFNGNRIDQKGNDNLAPEAVLRLAATPFGKIPGLVGHQTYDEVPGLDPEHAPPTLRLGVNVTMNMVDRTKQIVDPGTSTIKDVPAGRDRMETGGFDAQFFAGPFVTQGEVYARRNLAGDGTTSWSVGAYAHAGLFVLPKHLEVAVRASVVDVDVDKPGTDIASYEGQLSLYLLGHHLKTSARYSLNQGSGAISPFPAGTSHAFVWQAQVWF